jgi:ATP-dependent DNA helicase RecQ
MRRVVARKRKVIAVRGIELGAVTGTDLEVLEALKVWRREEARQQGVPAYVILHDSTLLELARRRPRDLLQMNGITGIGAKRLERYGAALLRLLRAA